MGFGPPYGYHGHIIAAWGRSVRLGESAGDGRVAFGGGDSGGCLFPPVVCFFKVRFGLWQDERRQRIFSAASRRLPFLRLLGLELAATSLALYFVARAIALSRVVRFGRVEIAVGTGLARFPLGGVFDFHLFTSSRFLSVCKV